MRLLGEYSHQVANQYVDLLSDQNIHARIQDTSNEAAFSGLSGGRVGLFVRDEDFERAVACLRSFEEQCSRDIVEEEKGLDSRVLWIIFACLGVFLAFVFAGARLGWW